MNAWNIAAFEGDLNVMKKIMELAKERLITDEIKMKCYYVETTRE